MFGNCCTSFCCVSVCARASQAPDKRRIESSLLPRCWQSDKVKTWIMEILWGAVCFKVSESRNHFSVSASVSECDNISISESWSEERVNSRNATNVLGWTWIRDVLITRSASKTLVPPGRCSQRVFTWGERSQDEVSGVLEQNTKYLWIQRSMDADL